MLHDDASFAGCRAGSGEIVQELRSESKSAAIGFRERFGSMRTLLERYPLAGRQTDDPLLRCINMNPYPYLVFYDVLHGSVVIMRIMHGARDPRSMPARPR